MKPDNTKSRDQKDAAGSAPKGGRNPSPKKRISVTRLKVGEGHGRGNIRQMKALLAKMESCVAMGESVEFYIEIICELESDRMDANHQP